MTRRRVAAMAALVFAWSAIPSGPERYLTPFVARVSLDDVIAGSFPERLRSNEVVPLVVYLHLRGRFSESHAALFASAQARAGPAEGFVGRFWDAVREEGQERPAGFVTWKLASREYEDPREAGRILTDQQYIHNCQMDAFRTAEATFLDRKSRYGSGSIELGRWIEAQIKVFAQCSGETAFDPPSPPMPSWQPLERHDRRYQIAAAHFYAGRYREAASRFGDIGRSADSPWRNLGRYLVGRSLVREATVNANDPPRYLDMALEAYRELEAEPAYVAEFPSVAGQIRFIRATIDPVGVRRELERSILDDPASVSARDMTDYSYLRRRAGLAPGMGETDYERWLWHATDYRNSAPEGAAGQWRIERSLPWLYVALLRASPDLGETTLTELLEAAEAVQDDAAGYVNVLLQRLRIMGLLGQGDAGLRLAEEVIGKVGLSRSQTNRIRLAAAELTRRWPDYLRWASLRPLSLPWGDAVLGLPDNYSRITTNTSLFGKEATDAVNSYFTSPMIEEVVGTAGLSDFQRGRLAIAGWTKAMLAEDLDSAVRLAGHVRRYVPWLERDMATFEQGRDKHFEAARIVFDYPAFSPWLEPGAGRVYTYTRPYRQIPDHVTYGSTWSGWWCVAWRTYRIDESTLRGPRFSGYTDAELATIRGVVDYRRTAATTAFGPHVIRYARDHLDDPRVPRALHRLVFATRHACHAAPGNVSQAAYALLHEHFPDSEWAAKTPYWYGQIE